MRYALLLVALSSLPCVAQERIFRASSIDVEQNERLDALEARLAVLERTPREVVPHLPLPQVQIVRPPVKQVAAAATCPCGQCPVQPRVAAATVTHSHPHVQTAEAPYTARWQNYDGLTFRQHAEQMHGINTAGMSDSEVGRLRDQDHDMYGGGHPAAMRARTVNKYVEVSSSGEPCPNGWCPPRNSQLGTVNTRGGLFGFGILGRRR